MRQAPITLHDAAHQPADDVQHQVAVRGVKPVRLGGEIVHARVAAPRTFAKPREMVPDYRVRAVLRGQRLAAPRLRFGEVKQALVFREAADDALVVGAAQHVRELAAPFGGVGVPALQCTQQWIAKRAGFELRTIVVELIEQHGREADRGARGRHLLQVPGHIRIIFDGVQVHPGLRVLAVRRAIARLVHVPAEHDVERCAALRVSRRDALAARASRA
jgi:hypothetical protein